MKELWEKKRVIKGFWCVWQNRRRYIIWLGEKLGITSREGWYKVTQADVAANFGGGLIAGYYNNSIRKFVIDLFPEYDWLEWKFATRLPRGWWQDDKNCHSYLVWLGKLLNCKTVDDWHNLNTRMFHENYGGGLLQRFGDSCVDVIQYFFTNTSKPLWVNTNKKLPQGFWSNRNNRRAYLDWLGALLGYKTQDDWYQVTKSDFDSNGGRTLLYHYNSSISSAVMDVMSEHLWLEWKFNSKPKNFFMSNTNALKYLNWLGVQLGFNCKDDWYRVTEKDFVENYGVTLLKRFGYSPQKTLVTLLGGEWLEWKFNSVPKGFWKDKSNHLRYMQWLGAQLGFSCMDAWYNVTKDDFYNHGGRGLLNKKYSDSPSLAVMSIFSNYDWDTTRFSEGKSRQKHLYHVIHNVYQDAKFDYWHPNLRFSTSGRKMQLDVYIPSKRIAFEYQDRSHFEPIYGEEAFEQAQKRDKEKVEACQESGIQLYVINYWEWDGSESYILGLLGQNVASECIMK